MYIPLQYPKPHHDLQVIPTNGLTFRMNQVPAPQDQADLSIVRNIQWDTR